VLKSVILGSLKVPGDKTFKRYKRQTSGRFNLNTHGNSSGMERVTGKGKRGNEGREGRAGEKGRGEREGLGGGGTLTPPSELVI
jgi:hypothetical protein